MRQREIGRIWVGSSSIVRLLLLLPGGILMVVFIDFDSPFVIFFASPQELVVGKIGVKKVAENLSPGRLVNGWPRGTQQLRAKRSVRVWAVSAGMARETVQMALDKIQIVVCNMWRE